ncbi:MAG: transketolase family protein [Vicinamibacterales bacterium]
MRKQFKDTMTALATEDERVVLLFGDISVYLFNDFQATFPDRFYNLGICEATLVSMAAGLRSQGLVPVVHSIAPFVTERAMEQIKVDLCYNRLPANIVSCGATFDYAWDGATHHAWMDLAFMRLLPATEVLQPGSPAEADFLIRTYYDSPNTSYFRLSDHTHGLTLPLQRGRGGAVVRDMGAPVTIVTAGPILADVLGAVSDLPVNVIYFHTLKPFDDDLLHAYSHTDLRVVHDSFGLFEAVSERAAGAVRRLGLPDRFCETYGTLADARRNVGLGIDDIRAFAQSAAPASHGRTACEPSVA